jgi:hypothetical protein
LAVQSSTRINSAEKARFLTELDAIQTRHKATKRRLTVKYTAKFKERKVAEAEQSLTVDSARERIRGSVEGGYSRGHESAEKIASDLKQDEDNDSSSADEEDLWSEDEEIEGHEQDEPAAWKDLPNEVTIDSEEPFSDNERVTLEQRIEALKAFVKEGQSESTRFLSMDVSENTTTTISTANYCHLCTLDDSVPADRASRTWTKTQLDRHLRSGYHGKAAILKRYAISELESKDSTDLQCYICMAENEEISTSGENDTQYIFNTAQQYVNHLTQVHKYGLE